MTGKHTGHATSPQQRAVQEGRGRAVPAPAEDVTVAELLKATATRTGASASGGSACPDTTGSPLKHGFDLLLRLQLPGPRPQPLPDDLCRNDTASSCTDNDGKTGEQLLPGPVREEALTFIDKNKDKPFFLYLPFIVPHVAVQVPEDSLAEYRGKLGDDPPTTARRATCPTRPRTPATPRWSRRMDRSVGRIVEKLKELKLDENTLVIFTSDNGPTHNVGGADSTFFHSAGTLARPQGRPYEGGIRVPFIASGRARSSRARPCDEPLLLPGHAADACAELAGATPPRDRRPSASCRRSSADGSRRRTTSSTGSSPPTAASRRCMPGTGRRSGRILAKGS